MPVSAKTLEPWQLHEKHSGNTRELNYIVAAGALHATHTLGANFVCPSRLYASVFANQVVTYIAFFHVDKLAYPSTALALHDACTTSSPHASHGTSTAKY